MRKLIGFALAAGLAAAMAPVPALADDGAACPTKPVLPAPLGGWTAETGGEGVAAADPADASVPLALGRRVRLALFPSETIAFAAAPEKVPGKNGMGAVVAIDVAKAGKLTVALGQGAWIDLLREAAAVPSTGHGHGAACSGIRKMVDFAVVPGRYLLQVSGAAAEEIDVMAVLRD